MTIADAVYIAFVLAALAAFRFWQPRVAAMIVFFGGWVILPVGNFTATVVRGEFAYWVLGLVLPSDMLITKAWVAPCAALLGTLVFDWRRVSNWRPSGWDAPIVLLCLWPLAQAALVDRADPDSWAACLYLTGSWGATWLLGRLHGSDIEGRRLIARSLAWSAAACLPFTLLESVAGPFLHDVLYGAHSMRWDGAERYIGYRPLGFFEDGNQFGLWIAMGTIAALWLAGSAKHTPRDRVVAAVLIVMTLVSQSVGAILLAALGIALLALTQRASLRVGFAAGLTIVALAGAVMLSGRVPLRQIAMETSLGRATVGAFSSVGRGSLPWRIAQEQRLLRPALARPLVGTATWDWWRAEERRPWGMTLLMIGQLGLVGLAAGAASLLAPAGQVLLRRRAAGRWGDVASLSMLFAVVIAMALLDALLNSFVYFPALLLAGTLAGPPERLS